MLLNGCGMRPCSAAIRAIGITDVVLSFRPYQPVTNASVRSSSMSPSSKPLVCGRNAKAFQLPLEDLQRAQIEMAFPLHHAGFSKELQTSFPVCG